MAFHGFGGNGIAAIGRLNRTGEEIFEFKHPARTAEIFIAGHAADRAVMHINGIGDIFEG